MLDRIREAWARVRTQIESTTERLKPLYDERVEQVFILILIAATVLVFILFWAGRADLAVWVGGLAFLSAGVIGLYVPPERKTTWVQHIAPELIGISIGVLAIDQLYQLRLEQQEKAALILQLGSPSNDFAVEAVRITESKGWLRDGSIKGANLGGANLKGANLGGANLKGANLGGANLQGADLREANLEGANLGFASLQDAKLLAANLQDAKLLAANLQGADLGFANLKGADLQAANLQGADLGHANFKGADLGHANLRGADLVGRGRMILYLVDTISRDGNLNDTEPDDGNLNDTELEDAKLEGVFYDDETVWPDGFDYRAAGAVYGVDAIQEK